MSNKKAAKNKKAEKPAPKKQKIELTNSQFEIYFQQPNTAAIIQKLKACLSGQVMFDFHKFCKGITESIEFKAYVESRDSIVKEFHEEQKKKNEKERIPGFVDNIPKWKDLLERKSGLQVEKFQLKINDIHVFKTQERNIDGNDTLFLEGLIDFID